MKLHTLKKAPGTKKRSIQIGRGNGSGRGNYSTRGLKGAGSRSGFSVKPFFAGGQTPLNLRLPKLPGFKKYYKLVKNISVCNVVHLEKDDRITTANKITKSVLVELGYAHKGLPVKILGNGELSKSLHFEGIEQFSNTAREKILKTGGSIA